MFPNVVAMGVHSIIITKSTCANTGRIMHESYGKHFEDKATNHIHSGRSKGRHTTASTAPVKYGKVRGALGGAQHCMLRGTAQVMSTYAYHDATLRL